jgi:hypothetical protein
MQSAKDSFYMALRQRLAAVNSARIVTLDGTQQPAILVEENEPVTAGRLPFDCFCISFGAAVVAPGFAHAGQPLMVLDCTIAYSTRGSAVDGCDRGRALGALDSELLQICSPACAPTLDYTHSPAVSLASKIFWLRPELQAVEDAGGAIQRKATLKLFFLPEVSA